MAGWQRSGRGDVVLRLAGALLCLVAWRTFARLIAWDRVPGAGAASGLPFVLGTLGFLSACAGAAMLLLGRHLFDEVEVSSRWR